MLPQANVKNEIAALIDRKDHGALRKYLEPWLPMDIAPLFADLPVEQLAALFRVGSKELAATTFTYMRLRGAAEAVEPVAHRRGDAATVNAVAGRLVHFTVVLLILRGTWL